MSAAKRYRLRCLKAVILALAAPDAPTVELGEDDSQALTPEEKAKQVPGGKSQCCARPALPAGTGASCCFFMRVWPPGFTASGAFHSK